MRITASIDLAGRQLPELPRFGLRLELPRRYDQVRYYGRGLCVEGAGQPICFGALPFRTEDLDSGLSKQQQHPTGLQPHEPTFRHLDLAWRGVGGDTSWGALPHDAYRLLATQYTYSYPLRLLDGPEAAARTHE